MGKASSPTYLFTFELQRRSDAGDAKIRASHAIQAMRRPICKPLGPGCRIADDEISLLTGNRLLRRALRWPLPTQYAAAAPNVRGGDYFGPNGIAEL